MMEASLSSCRVSTEALVGGEGREWYITANSRGKESIEINKKKTE